MEFASSARWTSSRGLMTPTEPLIRRSEPCLVKLIQVPIAAAKQPSAQGGRRKRRAQTSGRLTSILNKVGCNSFLKPAITSRLKVDLDVRWRRRPDRREVARLVPETDPTGGASQNRQFWFFA